MLAVVAAAVARAAALTGEARHELATALAFLTRLPVRPGRWSATDLAASAPMFPLVGALLGLAGGLVCLAAAEAGLPGLLAACLAVAAVVALTGGLHEDGLADVADGFGGGRDAAAKLRIMRDSRLGSFGALALLLALLGRIAALDHLAGTALVVAAWAAAAAASRALLPAMLCALPRARTDGLAVSAGRPHPGRALAAALVAVALALLLLPPAPALAGLLTVAALGGAMAALARRQIGGITGDVLGASALLAELGFLAAVTAFAGPA